MSTEYYAHNFTHYMHAAHNDGGSIHAVHHVLAYFLTAQVSAVLMTCTDTSKHACIHAGDNNLGIHPNLGDLNGQIITFILCTKQISRFPHIELHLSQHIHPNRGVQDNGGCTVSGHVCGTQDIFDTSQQQLQLEK